MSYSKIPSNEHSWSEKLIRGSLRKQATQLEYQINSRLIALQTNPSNSLYEEIQKLLDSLTTITQEMDAYSGDPTHQHLISRHVSNLYEYNREFKKTRQNNKAQQDHHNLLQGGISLRNTGFQQQHDRMGQAHDYVDEIMMTAVNSAEEMGAQSRRLNSMQNRLARITSKLLLIQTNSHYFGVYLETSKLENKKKRSFLDYS